MSEKVAESMVTHILKDGGKTWRQAAALNGKGKIIYKALKNELKSHGIQLKNRGENKNSSFNYSKKIYKPYS